MKDVYDSKTSTKFKGAECPNPNCDWGERCYCVDDLTPHKCDKCGTTWQTYDPQDRIENAINIKIS